MQGGREKSLNQDDYIGHFFKVFEIKCPLHDSFY